MEIEAKYTVPDRATFDRLLELRALDGFALREAATEHVTDHYLDTPTRAVERGGYALRLRQTTDQTDWLATLKSLGGADGALHHREEHEAAVPPMALPAAWPEGPARDVALRLAGSEPVAELFDLEQVRHRRLAYAEGERLAAELSLDMVTITTAMGDQVSYELELELRPDGTPDDLTALAAGLGHYGLAPQPLSKYARALALLEAGAAPAPPPAGPRRRESAGVLPDDPMGEAGRKVLRFHFERMVAQEDGVRAGLESRPVHAMRVAARRQRAALRVFGDFLPPKALRRARRGLQAVARRLGAVRDLDVQLEALREYQAGLPPERAAGLAPLVEAWQTEREAAREGLVAHLDSRGYARFKRKYAAFTGAPLPAPEAPPAREVHPQRLRHVMPGRLWDHYAAVRAYEYDLEGAPIERLHALRIEGKRLRYALEFVAEAMDPAVDELIEAVVALQEHLGALHDLDVCLARLSSFEAGQAKGEASRLARRAARAYLVYCRGRLSHLRRTLSQPWRDVAGPRFRKRLGRVTSKL
jgi:CHAD domain-containing protein